MTDKSDFRQAVNTAIREAHDNGATYQEIMADLATVMGYMVAAGSPVRETRLAFVKSSMAVIASVIDRDLN